MATPVSPQTDPQAQREKPPISKDDFDAVGRMLKKRYERYKQDRLQVEQQWLTNLRQILGEYDPETLRQLADHQSRAYPRITRVKCTSMISRLMSLLFPGQEQNWGVAPKRSPALDDEALVEAVQEWQEEHQEEELTLEAVTQAVAQFAQKRAQNLERLIDGQLSDVSDYGSMDYAALVRKVVQSGVHYSMGVVKGPMTLQTGEASYDIDEDGAIVVAEGQGFRPFFQFVSVWDYFPDLSASSFDQMEGQFQRHVFAKHQLVRLADRDDFLGDKIREYVRKHPDGNYVVQTNEVERRGLGKHQTSKHSGSVKYEVYEYWGHIGGTDLMKLGKEIAEKDQAKQHKVTIWVLDNVVIKAQLDPFPEGVSMYHQFVFEEDDVNLCGSGLPPIMRDSQMAVANSARMLLDNAAATCGPQYELDMHLLYPGQDTSQFRPFKIWLTDSSQAVSNGRQAVRAVSTDSHIPELQGIIELFNQIADTETFVGPMTGGDFSEAPSESLRTTGNMSMALSNAALPFRDIVRNFDQFTVSVIQSLIAWNQLFKAGEEIHGDMRPLAKGATSLIAKEVRAQILDNLSQTLTPEEMDFIDSKALLKRRLSARDLPLDELLVPDEVAEKRRQERTQAQQEQQRLAQERHDAEVEEIRSSTLKDTSQAQKNLDAADANLFHNVLQALKEGIDPDDIIAHVSDPEGSPLPSTPGAGAGLGEAVPQEPDGGLPQGVGQLPAARG